MEEPPFSRVKIIEKINNPGMIKPIISSPLPHMGPVLLFYVGVIVFVVGTTAGKGNRFLPSREVPEEVIIEELGAVIAVKTENLKGKLLFNVPDLFKDPCFSLSPYGPLFCPPRGDIDKINGEGEHPCHGLPAVCHRIGFKIPRT